MGVDWNSANIENEIRRKKTLIPVKTTQKKVYKFWYNVRT